MTETLAHPGILAFARVLTPDQCAEMIALPTVMHHDEDGGHAAHAKTLFLPHVARIIHARIRDADLGPFELVGVDEMMKAYRLAAPEGAVPAHVDDDFDGPDGSRALLSVIVYLDEGYEGGETAFEGGIAAPRHGAGDVLVFRHDIRHEARAVTRGVKHVLKTDAFVRRRDAR
jgi:hypothetical protein